MTKLEYRLAHLEREISRLRRRNLFTVAAAIAIIAFACKDKAAPAQPATSAHFGNVTLDSGGLTIQGEGDKRVTLDSAGLHLGGADTSTALGPGTLLVVDHSNHGSLAVNEKGSMLTVSGKYGNVDVTVTDVAAGVRVSASDASLDASMRVGNGDASVATAASKGGGSVIMSAEQESASVQVEVDHGSAKKDLSVSAPKKK